MEQRVVDDELVLGGEGTGEVAWCDVVRPVGNGRVVRAEARSLLKLNAQVRAELVASKVLVVLVAAGNLRHAFPAGVRVHVLRGEGNDEVRDLLALILPVAAL